MLEKKIKEKKTSEKVVKKIDLKKTEVNRKLIGWAFIFCGIISGVLWWKGRGESGEGGRWWEGWIKPVEIAFDVPKTGNGNQEMETLKEREKMLEEIEDRVSTASGMYAVYVYELEERVGFGFNEREKMAGASILKLPAMIAAVNKIEKGEWSLEDEFELKEVDRSPGSGPLQFEPAGTMVDANTMLEVLGKNSDNTAWRMVNRLVGLEGVENVMLKVGMTDSNYAGGAGDVTAVDVGKLLVKVYDQEVVELRGKQLMEGYLTESIYEDRIPVGIDDEGVTIIHKVGTLADVWSDAGIVEPEADEPFVLVILNQGVIRAEASSLVPWIAERVWEFETNR